LLLEFRNEDHEIQVDGTVYKITPFGTFIYMPEEEDRVDELILTLQNGGKINEFEKDDYFYEVEQGICRYDTFKEVQEQTTEYAAEIPGPSNTSNPGSYEDIALHVITNKHTVVGKFLQNTFGFSASYSREFSSRRRIKLEFSSPNYILFSYINVKVRFQKKNWIGWSTTECEQLVLGWDGITYSFKNPIPMPQPGSQNNNNWGNYNPNWTRAEINPPASNKTYLALSIPEFKINITDSWSIDCSPSLSIKQKELNQAYKSAFTWLKGKLAPTENKDFLAIIPDPNTVIIGPEEFLRTNAECTSKTFDWSVGLFKFNWNMSSSIGYSNFNVKPMGFSIKNASIYGKAYCDGRWLGIRIEKR